MSLELATTLHVQDGVMTIGRSQDCTAILTDAQRRHNEGLHGSSEMKHAARIPNIIIEKYCNEHNVTYADVMQNKEHMRRMLNDPALSGFRIWPGRV